VTPSSATLGTPSGMGAGSLRSLLRVRREGQQGWSTRGPAEYTSSRTRRTRHRACTLREICRSGAPSWREGLEVVIQARSGWLLLLMDERTRGRGPTYRAPPGSYAWQGYARGVTRNLSSGGLLLRSAELRRPPPVPSAHPLRPDHPPYPPPPCLASERVRSQRERMRPRSSAEDTPRLTLMLLRLPFARQRPPTGGPRTTARRSSRRWPKRIRKTRRRLRRTSPGGRVRVLLGLS
jgi:hypothetical protein